jgi:hypothetical protein
MYATQIEWDPGIDFILVRIRDPKAARAVEAANAGQVDPELAPARAQSGEAPGRANALRAWSAEHALFIVTLAASACLEALAALA